MKERAIVEARGIDSSSAHRVESHGEKSARFSRDNRAAASIIRARARFVAYIYYISLGQSLPVTPPTREPIRERETRYGMHTRTRITHPAFREA